MGRSVAIACAFVVGAVLVADTAQADSVLGVWDLSDHPDAAFSPPPYGLRFDNLFANAGGDGGLTTFSFDYHSNTTLTATMLNSGDIRISIVGTIYGGEATGGFGLGSYDLDYTYDVGVAVDGTGFVVNTANNSNTGSLTAQVGTPFAGGASAYAFGDKGDTAGNTFLFLQDGHRMNQAERDAFGGNPWVGRGWFLTEGLSGTRDFLFVATLVPLPSAAGLALVGLAGLTAVNRRR